MEKEAFETIKKELDSVFSSMESSRAISTRIIGEDTTTGKLYEVYVLSKVLLYLTMKEGYFIVLMGGSKVKLRSSPGGITRSYPWFNIYKTESDYRSDANSQIAEIWTDIEFSSLSYDIKSKPGAITKGEFHELDIMMVNPGLNGKPTHDNVLLGIECKNTRYKKAFLREILGIRRELSLLTKVPVKTFFGIWPTTNVKANPPSVIQVFCTDPKVANYKEPGDTFSVDFYHLEMKL